MRNPEALQRAIRRRAAQWSGGDSTPEGTSESSGGRDTGHPPEVDGVWATETTGLSDDDRAVSEAIGFVIVFSIIIVSVGVIYVSGFNTVSQWRVGEQLKNAERTFEALDRNFDDIQQRGAPSRSGEVNLNGGTLSVTNESTITVNVTGSANFNRTIPLGALSYEYDRRHIDYENGAVFRRSPDGGVMLTQPQVSCRDDTAVISVVTLNSTEREITGTHVVTVSAEKRSSRVLLPKDRPAKSVDSVNVTVDSPNQAAWDEHLASSSGWSDPEGDGSYECSGVDTVFVRQTVINVTFMG
jgi:hypothetical protein